MGSSKTNEAKLRRRLTMQQGWLKKSEAEQKAAVDKQRLSNLQQREQRVLAQSTRLGGQSMMDRQMGLHAARFIKQHGLKNATLEMQQLAGSFAPEWLQKEREKHGRTTAEYKAGVKEGFLFDGDPDKLRKEQRDLQTNIRQGEVHAEAAAAEKFGAQLGRFVDALDKILDAKLAAIVAGQKAGEQIRQAGQ